VVEAVKVAFDRSVLARAEFVAGNFFRALPSGAELYTITSILHDWNDADCQKILVNVRRAMPTASRLLILLPFSSHLLHSASVRFGALSFNMSHRVSLGDGSVSGCSPLTRTKCTSTSPDHTFAIGIR
jgi:hypothetical protein